MVKIYKFSLSLALMVLSMGMAYGQYTVTGVVTDERTGESLIGASVLVRNTTRGTVADIDGRFSISFDSNEAATLVISSFRVFKSNI